MIGGPRAKAWLSKNDGQKSLKPGGGTRNISGTKTTGQRVAIVAEEN